MGKWAKVARITRTRNFKGSLNVQSTDGLPFLLSQGMQVWFVPPTLKGPRTGRIEDVEKLDGRTWSVAVDSVTEEKDAEDLAGRYVLALKSDLPHDLEAEAPVGLVGWRVTDETLGDLGTVADVTVNPAQSLLVVEGELGQVLIPVVDAFIRDVDEEQRALTVRIPEGLIGLDGQGA